MLHNHNFKKPATVVEALVLLGELSDDVLKGCVVTHEGQIVNDLVNSRM